MVIEYRPTECGTEREFGAFQLGKSACVEFLHGHIDAHAIVADRRLLDWIEQAKSTETLPTEFDDRARHMLAELFVKDDDCEVTCLACQQGLNPKELIRRDWDESVEEHGIRVGVSGFKLVCPREHDLVVVTTRIF